MKEGIEDIWRRGPDRPCVLGHRGARHAAPENTLAAFRLAVSEGADGIELDVRLNATGDVIVLHDPTLNRVTEWHDCRRAETLTTADLRGIDVGGGERIPLLGEVLEWAAAEGARVNVELKHDVSDRRALANAVVHALKSAPVGSTVLLSSFHPGIVFALRRALSGVPVGWLVHHGQRVAKYTPGIRLLGANAVHPQRTLATADRIARWKASGLLINVWTVNDPEEGRRLASLGVDALISDNPGAILAGLRTSPNVSGCLD